MAGSDDKNESNRRPAYIGVSHGAANLWMLGIGHPLSMKGLQSEDRVLKPLPDSPCTKCVYVASGFMCGKLEECPKPI